MAALLMTEIVNFTIIEEKNEFYKKNYKKFHKEYMTGGVDIQHLDDVRPKKFELHKIL